MKTIDKNLIFIEEPYLSFGSEQKALDPRDGLLLYGPNEKFENHSIRAGVIGTKDGIELYRSFVNRLKTPIFSTKKVYGKVKSDEIQRPSFPGFEAVFGVSWNDEPEYKVYLDEEKITELLSENLKKKRTLELVSLYANQIKKARDEEDISLDIWFAIVPREIYIQCRFGSKGRDINKKLEAKINALMIEGQISLFPEMDDELRELDALRDSSSDFHNLLKAKLLEEKIETPIQIIVEPTLQFKDKLLNRTYEENIKSHLAWTQSTTVYYKLGKLPWKLTSIRDEVCYLGLVFKKVSEKRKEKSVCSAAQMFLKDGDGTIFRGNIGLFKSENSKEYHLDEDSATELLGMALDDYYHKRGVYPKELFIHGRVRFNEIEWVGFERAIQERKAKTLLNGIVIKDTRSDNRKRIKLFRDVVGEKCEFGILRGLAIKIDNNTGYLFSRGFIPRLNTSNCLEIANPLYIEVNRGETDITTVMKDILALTKLNYNSCVYGDGLPVTLRFSDMIGSILTATSTWQSKMRQFKYYI
ncbi:MAG: hypothetical protein ACTSYF_08605 [Promethearchaeota archaeon]